MNVWSLFAKLCSKLLLPLVSWRPQEQNIWPTPRATLPTTLSASLAQPGSACGPSLREGRSGSHAQ